MEVIPHDAGGVGKYFKLSEPIALENSAPKIMPIRRASSNEGFLCTVSKP